MERLREGSEYLKRRCTWTWESMEKTRATRQRTTSREYMTMVLVGKGES